jgi:hypothetical protein
MTRRTPWGTPQAEDPAQPATGRTREAARNVAPGGLVVQLRLAQVSKLAVALALAAGCRRRTGCLRRGLLGGGLPLRFRSAHLAGRCLLLPGRGRLPVSGTPGLVEAALQECRQVDDVGGLRRLLGRRDLLARVVMPLGGPAMASLTGRLVGQGSRRAELPAIASLYRALAEAEGTAAILRPTAPVAERPGRRR